ncbi:hypothetical protein [Paenibacillus sp. 1P07SE]|uniref:hypothetical protein n=1 Tax=Paenibacillus sp. 1P07SE TaxID=3132209 RepID=UPI0039A74996
MDWNAFVSNVGSGIIATVLGGILLSLIIGAGIIIRYNNKSTNKIVQKGNGNYASIDVATERTKDKEINNGKE